MPDPLTLPAQAALRSKVELARVAVGELRDAAREGRVIGFRQRDPLVMQIHNALDALQSALLDAETGTGWQPIETAPRDCHAIIGLAWNGQVQPIWWSKTYNEWMWADGLHSGQALRMTHWQPLPTSPLTEPAQEPR